MTSIGGKIDYDLLNKSRSYSFGVNGDNYHIIGSLITTMGNCKDIQLYIHNTKHNTQNRMNILDKNDRRSSGLNILVLEALNKMLDS